MKHSRSSKVHSNDRSSRSKESNSSDELFRQTEDSRHDERNILTKKKSREFRDPAKEMDLSTLSLL